MNGLMEQLRQKDEKLEAYSWRLMSMELESRQLQSHIEALDREIAQLRKDNAKLDSEEKLQDRFLRPRKLRDDDTVWSRVKVVRQRAGQMMMEDDYKDDETSEMQDIVLTPKKDEDDEVNGRRWKMDVHALGVSYKVKRLKQQVLVLERLAEKEEGNERVKGFYALMSLLNKQVERYDSLQGKIDQLCKRMKESSKDETKRMEQFLEETFQLQRYIVATGQKVMEVESMIGSNLVAEAEDTEKHGSFEIERFAESVKTLFRETQRGLEVRISRIIGDLEGTLARDGFNSCRKLCRAGQ